LLSFINYPEKFSSKDALAELSAPMIFIVLSNAVAAAELLDAQELDFMLPPAVAHS
jgi:hypothetical protein